MRRSSDIFSQYLYDLYVDDIQLKEIQDVGKEMLSDFHVMCQKANIKYSVAYGTMLGAIRHKGFIPWDDDIDVFILKSDVNKLIEIINKDYADKYYILDRNVNKKYCLPFPKLIRKNTKLTEIAGEGLGITGCFIDLFLLDDAPKRFLKLKQGLSKINRYSAILECEFKYPSNTLLSESKKYRELNTFVRNRRVMGLFTSILPLGVISFLNNMLLKGPKDNDKYVIIGDDLRIIEKKLFEELQLFEFDGIKVFGISNFDKYLTDTYGDYMKIPPKNQQVRHAIIELDISKS